MSTDQTDAPTSPAAVPADSPTRRPRSRRAVVAGAAPFGVLLILVVAVSVANPGFLRRSSLVTLADSAAPLLVLAAGATLVILCGGIDLSVAALASLGSVLLALWIPVLGVAAVPAVIAVTALCGALQGAVHVIGQVPSFVVTLGGLALWSGIALTISDASTIAVSDFGATDWAFTRIGGTVPSAVLIALIAVLLLAAALRLTPLGRWVTAIGSSEPAALLAGVPVARVKVVVFALSGACAGLAATLLVARTYSGAPSLADSLLLPVVAAVVVGGTAITGGYGGLARTLVGVLIIGVLRVGLSVAGVDPSYEQVLYGVLVIAAVALTIDRSKFTVIK